MSVKQIQEIIFNQIQIDKLDITDQTHQHSTHAQSNGLHIKMNIVSKDFEGKTLIERHRLIYGILGSMMKKEIHALSISAKTPEELDSSL